jgi:ABC-type Fe3+/spermidine/putrescine transport system ATPase subunit
MFEKMKPKWEYQVEQFGTALKSARTEEVEAFLNEAATEGWELDRVASMSNGSKLMVVLRRKLVERRRKRQSTWPSW